MTYKQLEIDLFSYLELGEEGKWGYTRSYEPGPRVPAELNMDRNNFNIEILLFKMMKLKNNA